MEENINVTRDGLKRYFETGDRPTEAQFSELIDGYAHLNEFNFGLSVKTSAGTARGYYHFYRAEDIVNSGMGHKIVKEQQEKRFSYEVEDVVTAKSSHKRIRVSQERAAESHDDYVYLFSRNVLYKKLDISLKGVNVEEHRPKLILERYRQKKKTPSGFSRATGYYQEDPVMAALWNRNSEYEVTGDEMILDIEPIHYFRPGQTNNFSDFMPSGSHGRPGTFKFTRHDKTVVPMRISVEIYINGIAYRSRPVYFKIVLAGLDELDSMNFAFY